MHGRHRRIPVRPRFIEPGKELQRVESRWAEDAGAGVDRRRQGADQPMDMKQRHYHQATIRRAQCQGLGNIAGRGQQIALQQRHDLGPRGRARCVQHQGRIAGAGEVPGGTQPGRHDNLSLVDQEQAARGRFRDRPHIDDIDAAPLGHGTGRRIEPFLDQQQPCLDIREIEIEFLAAIGGIERCRDRAGGDPQEGHRHFRPVGQHHGDAIGLTHTKRVERAAKRVHLPAETGAIQHRAAGCCDGRCGSLARPDHVAQRGRHGRRLYSRLSSRHGLPPAIRHAPPLRPAPDRAWRWPRHRRGDGGNRLHGVRASAPSGEAGPRFSGCAWR